MRITPGFLLTMAVMFWLDEGVGLLGWGVLACVVHELGHLLVGAALGGRPRWLSLSAVGLELNMEYPAGLSYGRELAVALAGPAVNLVTGGICAQFGNYLLAGVSFGLGLFNLIPIPPLDGSKVLFSLLPDRAYNTMLRYERYGMLLLWAVVLLGVGDKWMSAAIQWTYELFCRVVGF